MKKIIVCICLIAIFLGLVPIGYAQDYDFRGRPTYPPALVNYYKEQVEKCEEKEELLSLEVNMLRILLNAYPYNEGDYSGVYESQAAFNRNIELKQRLETTELWHLEACRDLEIALNGLIEALDALPPPPTPTPTPIPTTQPTPTPTPDEKQQTQEKQYKELRDNFIAPLGKHQQEIEAKLEEFEKFKKEVSEYVRNLKVKQKRDTSSTGELKSNYNNSNGLQTVEFETTVGKITLNLPDDIRAGDKISGTLTAEPKGNTEDERKKNEEQLKNYGLEIIIPPPPGGTAFPKGVTTVSTTASSTTPIWRATSINSTINFYLERPIEPLPAGYQIPINVTVTKNNPQTNIPIELVQLSLFSVEPVKVSAPTSPDIPWQMSQIIQIGNPIEIWGKFDGIADSTTLQIDGKSLEIIAESPRSCFFNSKPSEVGQLAYAQGNDIHLGLGEMTVKEGDKQQKLPFRAVGVGLSAPKLNLLRGEKTTVTVQVTGLKDLLETEILPLQLVSSGVINMAGGDSQSLQIRKKDLDKDGIYRTTREVIGHSNGGWGVTATVIDPHRRPIFIPLILNSKGNGYRSETRNGENLFTAFDVRHPLTGKLLEGEHKVKFGCEQPTPSLNRLPMVSQLFFNNGRAKVEKTGCLIMITPRIIIEE